MRTNYEIRYAAHPEDAKSYDTKRIRRDFLIEKVFSPNEVNMVYSMYDRMVVGGAMPVGEVLQLEAIDPLKAPYFLTRREMGIFNVGGPGVVRAGDAVFEMDYKEALYLGSGDREVTFESKDTAHPAKFLETVESIIGESVEIPAKLQEFMKGEKKSLQMTKEFADFKSYLLSL